MPEACMRCGRCCTSFGVCVTPADIRRIARVTGLPPTSFIKAIPEPPDREREEPVVLIDGKASLIILKWSKRMRCIFYGHGGCLVYSHRPLLCRTYPFRLINGDLVDLKSRACPVFWVPRSKEKGAYLRALRRYSSELGRYRRIAEKWNDGLGGDLERFLSFALSAAKSRKY